MDPMLAKFYNKVASKYDQNKGYSKMYPFLVRGMMKKTIKELNVLDVGCGTGEVDRFLLDEGVGSVSLMEPSKAMMDIAKEKLSDHIKSGRVKAIEQRALPQINFPIESFDIVMMNSVLHLVDSHDLGNDVIERTPLLNTPAQYPLVLKSFYEAYKVLKPGGILLMTVELPHQLRHSRWYAEFLPWRAAYDYPRQPNQEEFALLLKMAGFGEMVSLIDTNCALIDNEIVHDPYGIESEEWRAGDSSFLLLTETEMKEMLARVRDARENGELEEIMQRAKVLSDQFGQMTFIIARKEKVCTHIVNGNCD